ncbi:TonB-dependent receptor domain-containing protein [Arsenicibacter rosenii]|uniref:TonB-dependent receptor n=1 Tax=Arsenicibacter rosenii TaxID=1750698 RepID=A0A1S2VRF4_9BACT|nr:TonB-dependent receptor [Arsenicibacter rosenii]OIN61010.1 TonB-dependent receptor [Arsenicibacter rosenii]
MKQSIPILFLGISLCAQAQNAPPAGAPQPVPEQVIAGSKSGQQKGIKISGSIMDGTANKPVEFATVALINPLTDKPVGGTTTDERGRFSINNVATGTYRVTVSFMGYENKTINNIIVKGADIALGTVQMQADTRMLNEVVVTGEKPLVEDKDDRLVYNADKDLTNAGGTAVDVLKKVPLLTIDPDGNVQLKGSSSIKVLINNKPSSIMARSISEALQMIPAELIKSVEVITAPSAKYDAEGTAGVINIITKNQLQGLTGGLNASAGSRRNNLGGNINYKRGKLSVTGYGGTNWSNYFGGSQSVRQNLRNGQVFSKIEQQSNYRNRGQSQFGSFSVDYDLDTLNRIGIDANFGGDSRTTRSVRDTRQSLDTLREFRRYNNSQNQNRNIDLNFNYNRTSRRSSEQEFTFLAQYNRNNGQSGYALNQYPLPESEVIDYRERNENTNRQSELTLQTDYAYPFSTVKRRLLEVGSKLIVRDVNSFYKLENATDGSLNFQEDPRRANTFDYEQMVWSSYAAFRMRTENKWGFNIGGRFELTSIDANFISTKTRFADRYQNLLPNITVSKRLDDNRRFRANYSQRIQRPSIMFLNPYVNYSDPKNIQQGNPYLSPELAHSVELSYSTFSNNGTTINVMVFGRQTNNAIERITTVDASGISNSTYRNIARNATYGMNWFTSVKPVKAWNISGSVTINYNLLNSPALQTSNRNWSYQGNINTSLQLPANFSLQANGSYNSRRVQLQGQSSGFYYYGFSGRKEFKKQNLTLTANFENPFRKYNTIVTMLRTTTFLTDGSNYNVIRNIRLSVNWRFGKMSAAPERSKKKVNNDDRK